MFTRFLKWIGETIRWGFQQTWKLFQQYLLGFWALLSTAFYFLIQLLDYPIKLINWAVSSIEAQDIPAGTLNVGGNASSALAIANTFFPLDEFTRYFIAYCIWYAAWAAYRKIKSWFPTVCGIGFPSSG